MNPLLQGPLRRAIWNVAWPAMASQALLFLASYADLMMLQHFVGDEAAAGQTIGWTMLWLINSTAEIFNVGLTAVIARRVGEGRHDEARRVACIGLSAAAVASVAVGVAGWMLAPKIAGFSSFSGEAAGYTQDYLRVIFLGAPIFFLMRGFEGVFRGHGDTLRPLRAGSVAMVLNLILNPILILGLRLEVTGAAIATVASFGVTMTLLARAAWTRNLVCWAPALDFRLIGRIVRIGLPLSLYGIVFSIVYQFIFRYTAQAGGDAANTAIGHGLRMEAIVFMTSIGFSAAAAAAVGQNMGAGQLRRAHEAAWLCARYAVIIAGSWGLLLFLVPLEWIQFLVGAGNVETAVYTKLFLQIVAASMAFTAAEIALEGAFAGAGNSVPPMVIGVPFTILRIPLAWFLWKPMGLGLTGIYLAITISSIIRGILIPLWFARGRWVRGKA